MVMAAFHRERFGGREPGMCFDAHTQCAGSSLGGVAEFEATDEEGNALCSGDRERGGR